MIIYIGEWGSGDEKSTSQSLDSLSNNYEALQGGMAYFNINKYILVGRILPAIPVQLLFVQ